MNNLQVLSQQIDKIGYEINDHKQRKKIFIQKKDTETQKIVYIDEAIMVLTSVLTITQEGVVRFIREVVTSALQYVYGEEYSFKVFFGVKRNQAEVRLVPVKDGMEYDSRFSCGVGVIDVCSFALRCACYALKEPRTDNVLLLDESFKFISGIEQVEKVAIMIKKLSELLGLQIILISSKPALAEYADKIFMVEQIDGVSFITEKE